MKNRMAGPKVSFIQRLHCMSTFLFRSLGTFEQLKKERSSDHTDASE